MTGEQVGPALREWFSKGREVASVGVDEESLRGIEGGKEER